MRPLAAASLVLLAGCIGGAADRPVGSSCSDDGGCAGALVCQYGRCRAECAFDRDCAEGQSCVAAEGGGDGRVCTFEEEVGGCPTGLALGEDGLCHELCDPGGDPCSGPRQCSDVGGGTPVCVQISMRVDLLCSGAVIEASDGLACATTDATPALVTLEGLEAGSLYSLAVRFRGAVETTTYVDGVGDPGVHDFWRVGGTVEPGDAQTWNVYGVGVEPPTESYFVNADVFGAYEIHPIDFEASLLVEGGASLLLFALAGDGMMVHNPPQPGGELITVEGVDPPAANGQFLQMDVLGAAPAH